MDEQAELGRAASIWVGKGSEIWPGRHDGRVIAHYGLERGTRLLERLRALEEDFYASDAHRREGGTIEMIRAASADFRALHPDAADELVAAFEWCYSYDHK